MNAFKTIEKYGMLSGAKQVLCALSGGPDSVALTHFMAKNAEALGVKVCAAHFSHGIRPDAAKPEKELCEKLCKDLGIELFCGEGNAPLYAKEKGIGLELAARELRYAFLYDTALKLGGALIATAHHLTDNAETVIMNLIRGTSLKGLSGIPPVRDGIIRPFIETPKEEINGYIEKHALSYATDATNFEPCCRRNAIRLNVLPLLTAEEPAAISNIGRLSEIARSLTAEAEKEAKDALCKSFEKEGSVFIAVSDVLSLRGDARARLFCLLHKKAGGVSMLSEKHIKALTALCESDSPSRAASLPQIRVKREYENLVFGAKTPPEKPSPVILTPGESALFGEYEIKTCEGALKGAFVFDKGLITPPLTARPRREGDALFINKQNKSLKKLMIEKKIPKEKRDIIPVLCDNNKVIAAAEIGMDKRLLTDSADNALSVIIKRRR